MMSNEGEGMNRSSVVRSSSSRLDASGHLLRHFCDEAAHIVDEYFWSLIPLIMHDNVSSRFYEEFRQKIIEHTEQMFDAMLNLPAFHVQAEHISTLEREAVDLPHGNTTM
eukprot:CAMPEP_0183789740 /NCGR_PEP_ID=MMETSP0803_2-20130417/611_1 /TAXON_ID=195967 /ORGANISM="Crustomastix stigmata, Strain CCMP3273" /LENGTH=109 /DNA_ID=CAMNT_0026033919 /DNA_START=98 /DNA_END=427 /DNA_ORIENTATION=+